jgi:hypothetical protein
MAYEYYEKYSLGVTEDGYEKTKGNDEGSFTNDWAIS